MIFKVYPFYIKLTFYLVFYILICSQFLNKSTFFEKNNNTIIVDLVHQQFDDDFFTDSDFYYTSIKIGSFDHYPNYSIYLKENYKGIPINDSLSFHRCIDDRSLQSELYKLGDLSKEKEEWYLSHKDIDTLNLSKVKLTSTLIIIIGFYKDKQFMIADVNRNKDFSDDLMFEYDINFRNNPYQDINFLNRQPIAEYEYEICNNGKIEKYSRRFIIYPDRNNPFSISNGINYKKQREYFSILKFRDFWKGEVVLNNEEIEFYYHGYSSKYGLLYVKPKKVSYKRNSAGFESQYSHKNYANNRFDDTITISENRYKIDSINNDLSKLYLREVGKIKYFGNEVGNYLESITLKDLSNKSFDLKKLIEKKEFTLLEFWGTWCGPCVKMTPKIKDIYSKNSSRLNIVSIAVDEDVNRVKKYIKKNNLNWKFGFIEKESSANNLILNKLNIDFFPTFILIDSKGKIISRVDADSFDELTKHIK